MATETKKVIIEIDVDRKGMTKELQKANAEIDKLTKSQAKLRKEGKAGSIRFAKNKVALAQYRKEAAKLTKELAGTAAATKKANNSFFRLGNLFKGGLQIVGITTAIRGVWNAVGDAFNRIREFDKEMQNMAGIAQTSRKDLKDVEDTIREVAGESIKTSNEVAKLATTLFALGKTKEEVKLMLKPVNDLSIALNTTGDEAADFLGQTLNAFNKGAESSQEFADIIANVRASSSLDFERIKVALGFIAPTANALGETLGQTAAKMSVLQDNGIKAARAGRLMSTSYLKLADEGNNLEESLDKLGNSQTTVLSKTERLALASNIFGKEAAPLALILADNRDRVAELANEYDNLSEGSLKKLTDEQLKSLDAQIKILDSTYEDFILQIENGTGAISGFFRGAILGATDFIKALKDLNEFGEVLPSNYRDLVEEQAKALDMNKFINLQIEKGISLEDIKLDIAKQKQRAHEAENALIKEGAKLEDDAVIRAKGSSKAAEDAFAQINSMIAEKNKKEVEEEEKKTKKIKELTKEEIDARKKVTEKLIEEAKKLSSSTELLLEESEEKKLEIINEALKKGIEKQFEESDKSKEAKIARDSALESLEKKHQFQKTLLVKEGNEERRKEAEDNFKKDLAQAIKEGKAYEEQQKEIDEAAAANKAAANEIILDGVKTLEADISEAVFSAQFDRIAREEQTALSALDKKYGAQSDKLKAQLENETITKDEFDAAQLDLQKKFAADQLQIQKDAFDKDKKLKTQQIAINLVLELSNIALNAAANPANAVTFGAAGITQFAVQAGIATARAGVQAAAVQAAKFERGGLIEGPSHKEGGVPFTVGGRSGFEAEGDEIILTKGVYQNPQLRQIASDINVAGGGVELEKGGALRKYQGGGALGGGATRRVDESILLVNQQKLIARQIPPPVVSVKDIIKEVASRVKVVGDAGI